MDNLDFSFDSLLQSIRQDSGYQRAVSARKPAVTAQGKTKAVDKKADDPAVHSQLIPEVVLSEVSGEADDLVTADESGYGLESEAKQSVYSAEVEALVAGFEAETRLPEKPFDEGEPVYGVTEAPAFEEEPSEEADEQIVSDEPPVAPDAEELLTPDAFQEESAVEALFQESVAAENVSGNIESENAPELDEVLEINVSDVFPDIVESIDIVPDAPEPYESEPPAVDESSYESVPETENDIFEYADLNILFPDMIDISFDGAAYFTEQKTDENAEYIEPDETGSEDDLTDIIAEFLDEPINDQVPEMMPESVSDCEISIDDIYEPELEPEKEPEPKPEFESEPEIEQPIPADDTVSEGSPIVDESEVLADDVEPADVTVFAKTKHFSFEPRADEASPINAEASEMTRPFERPGIVKGHGVFGKTGDLTEVPAIMSAERALTSEEEVGKTHDFEIGGSSEKAAKEAEDAQMRLPGFDEKEEVEIVNEEEVENDLKGVRDRVVDSFVLNDVSIDEPVLDEEGESELKELDKAGKNDEKRLSAKKLRLRLEKPSVEYNRPKDRGRVAKALNNKLLISYISAGVTCVSTLVLIFTVAFKGIAEKIGFTETNIPKSGIVSLVFIILALVAGFATMYDGVTCFFKGSGKPNSRTPILAAGLVALIHNIVFIAIKGSFDTDTLYTPAASFALFLGCAGMLLMHMRISDNFRFLITKTKAGIHTVRAADGQTDVSHPGRESTIDEPGLRYSGITRFAAKFMGYSLAGDSTDDLCARLLPLGAIVILLISVAIGLIDQDFHAAMNTFACAACICLPIGAVIAANFPLFDINKSLRSDGGFITSYAAAYEFEGTNSIVVDAGDIFPASHCNIHGMKPFNGVRIDDAVLTAASMLISAGGSISHLFEEVIMGKNDLLLHVDSLVYEDRLGLSGWIRDRRIFLGNRKLLENHGVDIPMTFDERAYRKNNRRVMYLADSGKLIAIFVVSYGTDKRIGECLRNIEASGMTIVVKTTDSNITEDFIAKVFGLPVNDIRVVGTNLREVLTELSETPVDREDAQIIHNGKPLAYLRAICSANKLNDISGIINILLLIGSALGIVIVTLFSLFSNAPGAFIAILCQIIWTGVLVAVPKLTKE